MIDLLSDDSEELRAEVLSHLSGYGPSLETDLNTLFGSLNDELSKRRYRFHVRVHTGRLSVRLHYISLNKQ